MATTGFWPLKNRLKEVIDYAENPDKTIDKKFVDSDLYAVLQYVSNDNKTDKRMYVSGINCNSKRAYERMMATKKRFGKTEGNVAYHGYQNFQTGEVTPEEAHKIGLETARRMWGKEYEVVSGHRRLHAAIKAGLSEVPALIYPLNRTEAMIAVVDSNLHRERILPSEKAFAYKIKMDAMKAQGKRTDLTLSQVATKSDTAAEIGKLQNESRDKLFLYIRLTYLITELLDKVDEGVIALSPAVELSYLSEEQQKILLDAMSLKDCTPSHAQSIRMKKAAQQNTLSSDSIYEIMSEEKANQTERISFKVQDLKGFFPKNYTQKQMTDTILKLLYEYNRKLERRRNSRDER